MTPAVYGAHVSAQLQEHGHALDAAGGARSVQERALAVRHGVLPVQRCPGREEGSQGVSVPVLSRPIGALEEGRRGGTSVNWATMDEFASNQPTRGASAVNFPVVEQRDGHANTFRTQGLTRYTTELPLLNFDM